MAWLSLQSVGSRLASILSQMALAWLLSPATFGTIGLVYGLTTLISSAANFGIDTVLLQRQRSLRVWMVSGFWTSALLGLAGFAATLAVAPAAGALYHSPEFFSLAAIFGLSSPIYAVSTVPMVLMRSRLNFRFASIYNVIEFVATQSLTVILAWRGFGAYSFVIPAPIAAIVRAIVFFRAAPVAILGRARGWQFRYLTGSGLAVFLAKLAVQLVAQGDYFLLGVLCDKKQVGLYYFAFRLATQSLWVIAGNVSGVMAPILTNLAGRVAEQTTAAWKVSRVMAYVAIPACFLQAVLCPPFIAFFFPHRWTGATAVAAILSVGIGLDSITWIANAFLNARKEYRKALLLYVLFAPLFFLFVYIGAHYAGAIGAAAAVCAYYLVMAPTFTYLSFHPYGVGARDTLLLFGRPCLFAAIASIVPALLLTLSWPRPLLLVELAVQVALWGSAYLALLIRFEPTVLADLANRFVPSRHREILQMRLPGWLSRPLFAGG